MDSSIPSEGRPTLSTREYTRVRDIIASVRRHRELLDGGSGIPGSPPGQEAEDTQLRPSFVAEESFVHAPLNPRIKSPRAATRAKGKAKQESLRDMPAEIQEVYILEDLLFVLMGIEGTYITCREDYFPEDNVPLKGINFEVSKSIDPSLHDLVRRILPLATYYATLTSFMEVHSPLDFGLVNHAVCGCIRDMLKDYQTLLCHLEHAYNTSPTSTLQKLWFYVHPTLSTLSLIYDFTIDLVRADRPHASESLSVSSSDEELDAILSGVASSIVGAGGLGATTSAKGGMVLAILWNRLQRMSGDPTAKAVYGALFRAAGQPYMRMLRAWTRTGKMADPYEEMIVQASKYIDRGTLAMDYTDDLNPALADHIQILSRE